MLSAVVMYTSRIVASCVQPYCSCCVQLRCGITRHSVAAAGAEQQAGPDPQLHRVDAAGSHGRPHLPRPGGTCVVACWKHKLASTRLRQSSSANAVCKRCISEGTSWIRCSSPAWRSRQHHDSAETHPRRCKDETGTCRTTAVVAEFKGISSGTPAMPCTPALECRILSLRFRCSSRKLLRRRWW